MSPLSDGAVPASGHARRRARPAHPGAVALPSRPGPKYTGPRAGARVGPPAGRRCRGHELPRRGNGTPVGPETPVPGSSRALELFDLKQVFPRGYIEGLGRRSAFVEAPDGLQHVVSRGAYVGRNHGRVLDISRNRIQLSELVEGTGGGRVESTTELPHWAATDPSTPR